MLQFQIVFIYLVCVCVWGYLCASTSMWRSEANQQELVFSLLQGSWKSTQVIRLGGLYPHLIILKRCRDFVFLGEYS